MNFFFPTHGCDGSVLASKLNKKKVTAPVICPKSMSKSKSLQKQEHMGHCSIQLIEATLQMMLFKCGEIPVHNNEISLWSQINYIRLQWQCSAGVSKVLRKNKNTDTCL